MSSDISPQHSRRAVNKAGDALRNASQISSDDDVIENWRASHKHILNTFQENLRRKAKKFKCRSPVQRIKRRDTIQNKLNRFPDMKLARMHDIVGCRVIFDDLETLQAFRDEFNQSRFAHKRRFKLDENQKRVDAYNYIENPKPTGYRGIHDVFSYQSKPTGKSQLKTNTGWNGLNIEIQYRTNLQHAWATAVEICDVYLGKNGKFGEASKDYQQYFQVTAEMLARCFEHMPGALSDISDLDLVKSYLVLEKKLELLDKLRRIHPHDNSFDASRNTLIFYDKENEATHVETYDDFRTAVSAYFKAEREDEYLVVLVAADDSESVRFGFKNYFSDAREFVSLMESSMRIFTQKFEKSLQGLQPD